MTERNGEEREATTTELPPETKELLQSQDMFMWEAIVEAAHAYYGGEQLNSIPAVRREMDRNRRDKRDLVEEIHEREDEVDRLNQRYEELEAHLHKLEEQQETYEQGMDALLDDMVDSDMHVFVDHTRVQDLARKEYAGTTDEKQAAVLADLRERAGERNLGLSPERFEEADQMGGGW